MSSIEPLDSNCALEEFSGTFLCDDSTHRSTVGPVHSRRQQRTDQRVLVVTLKFLALKYGFPPVKNTTQICFAFFYIYIFYATFQCRRQALFKKKIKFIFCQLKQKKTMPQQVHIISPKLFFSQYCPTAKTSPKLIFHIMNMSQH